MSTRKTRKILYAKASLPDSRASTSMNGSLSSSLSASYKDELEAMFSKAPSIKELRKKAYLDKSRNSSNSSLSKSGSSTPTQDQNSSTRSNLVSSQSSADNESVFKKPILKTCNELDFSLKGLNVTLDTSYVTSPKRVFGNVKKRPKTSVDINPLSLENSCNSSDVESNVLVYKKNEAPAGLDLTNNSDFELSLNEISDQKLKDHMLRKNSLAKRKSLHLNNTSLENTINESEKEHTSKADYDLENLCKSDKGFNLSNDKSVKNLEEILDGANDQCSTLEKNYEDNNNLSKSGVNCAEGNNFISTEAESHATNTCDLDKIPDVANTNKSTEESVHKKETDIAQIVIIDQSAITSRKNFDLENPEVNLDINIKKNSLKDTRTSDNISNIGENTSNICNPDSAELLPLSVTYNTEESDSDKLNVDKEILAKKFTSDNIVKKNLSGDNLSQFMEEAIETQPENCNEEMYSLDVMPPAVVLKKSFSTSNIKGLNDSSIKNIEKSLDSSQLQDQLMHKLRKSAKQKRKSVRLSNVSFLVTDEEPVTPAECVKMVPGIESDKESRLCSTSKGTESLNSMLIENFKLDADSKDNNGLIGEIISEYKGADYSQDNDRNPLGQTFIVSQPCTPSLPVCNTTDTTFTVFHPKRLKHSEIGTCINESIDIVAEHSVNNSADGNNTKPNENNILHSNKEGKNEIDNEQSEKNKSIQLPTFQEPNNEQFEKNSNCYEAADFDLCKKNSGMNDELEVQVKCKEVTFNDGVQDNEVSSNIIEPFMHKNTLNVNDNGGAVMHINYGNITDGGAISNRESMTHTVNENQVSVSDETPLLNTKLVEETEKIKDDMPSDVVLKRQALYSELTSLNSSSFKSMDKSLNSSEIEDQLIIGLRKSIKHKKKSVRLSETALLNSNGTSDTSCRGELVSEAEPNEEFGVKAKSGSKEIISNPSELKSMLQDNVNNQPKDTVLCDNLVNKTSENIKDAGETKEDNSYAEISSQNIISSAILLKKPSLPSNLTSLNDTTFKNMEKSLDTSKPQNPLTHQLRKSIKQKKKSVRLSDASLLTSTRKSAIFSQDNSGNSNGNNYSEISSQNDTTSGGILKKPSMSNLKGLNDTTFKNMEKSIDITETDNQSLHHFKKSVTRKKKSVRLSNASLLVSNRESIDPSLCAEIVPKEESNTNNIFNTQEQGTTEISIVLDSEKLSTKKLSMCGEERINNVEVHVNNIEETDAIDLCGRDLSIINHKHVKLNEISSSDVLQDQDIPTNSSSISVIDENTYHVNDSRCVEVICDTQGENRVATDVISTAELLLRPTANENQSTEKNEQIVETVVNTPVLISECVQVTEGAKNSFSSISSQTNISSIVVLKKPKQYSNLTGLNDSSFKNMEQSLDTSKSQDQVINGLRKFVKQQKKSIRLSEAALFISNGGSTDYSLGEELIPEAEPNTYETCDQSDKRSAEESLKDKNENSNDKESENTNALSTCQELNVVQLENKADLQESCDREVHINSNEVISRADLQNNHATVNTRDQTIDEQVSSTVLCNSRIENTKAQDIIQNKEDLSISTVNEKHLSGEDPNISEKVPNKNFAFESSEHTQKPNGTLAKNTNSIISSLALKKPPLISENLNDSTITDLNDSYFKSMEKSLDSSVLKDQLMNRLRKSGKQKNISVSLSDATLLTSKDESVDSSMCEVSVPKSLLSDESSKGNLKKNVSNINELKSIPEEINTKDEVPNLISVKILPSDKNTSYKVVRDSSIVKTSACVQGTVEIQTENNYSVISSHNELTSAEFLKKSPFHSNDTILKNNDKSVDISETENQGRKSVNQKEKSISLSNPSQLISHVDMHSNSRSSIDMADIARLSPKNNDVIDIRTSLGHNAVDNSKAPSIIGNTLANVDKSNVIHNETAGGSKFVINQDNKVTETTYKKNRCIANHNETGNNPVLRINTSDAPDVTKLHQKASNPVSFDQKDEESPVKGQLDHNDVPSTNENNAASDHSSINVANISVVTGMSQSCNTDDNNIISSVSKKYVHNSATSVTTSETEFDENKSNVVSQNPVNDISVDQIDAENQTKPRVHQNVYSDVAHDVISCVKPINSFINLAAGTVYENKVNLVAGSDNENKVNFVADSDNENKVNLVAGTDNENKINLVAGTDNENMINLVAGPDNENKNNYNNAEYLEKVPDDKDPLITIGADVLRDKSIFKYPKSSKSGLLQNSRLNQNKSAGVLGKGVHDVASTSGKEESLDWSIDLSVIQPEIKLPYKLRLRSQSTPLPPKRLKPRINKSCESSPKPLQTKSSNDTPIKLVDNKKPKKSVTFNISSPIESEDGASPPLNTFTDISAIPGEGMRLGGKSKPVSSSPYPPSQRKRKQLTEIANQSVTSFSESKRSHKKNISVQVSREYVSSSSSRLSQSKSPQQFSSKRQSSFENASKKGDILHVSNKRKSVNGSSKGDIAHVSHKSDLETLSNKKVSNISHKKNTTNVSNKDENEHVSHKRDSISGLRKGGTLNESNLDDSTVAFHPKKKQRVEKSLRDSDNQSKEIDMSISSQKLNEKTMKSNRSSVRSKRYDSLDDVEAQNVDVTKVSMLRRNRALTSITNTERSRSLRSGTPDISLAEESVIFPPKKKAKLTDIRLEKSHSNASKLRFFSESRRKSNTFQMDDSIPLGYSVSDEEQSDYESFFNKHSWLKPLKVPLDDSESNVTTSRLDLSEELMPPPKTKQVVKKNKKLAKPAPWANQKFYKFLFDFFKPRYGIEYRKRSEDFVLFLYPYVQAVVLLNDKKDYSHLVLAVKEKTKELGLCKSIWDFMSLCDYLPSEFKAKSYYCGSKRYEPVIDHLAPF